jgi:hypothetical protein
MAFDPDAYLASKSTPAFDPDAYLSSKATPEVPAKDPASHDLIPFLKNVGHGLAAQADEFSSKPLASIAYDHLVQPAVDAYKSSRDAGSSMPGAALDAAVKGTGDLAGLGTAVAAPELTPVQAYMNSRRAGNSHDDAMKDARNAALLVAVPKALGAAVTSDAAGWVGKKVSKVATGVNEGSIDRYLANPSAVNGAADLPTKTKEFLADADARAAQGSADSTQSFNTLKKAGDAPLTDLTTPLTDAADHIHEMGVNSEVQQRAQGWLNNQAKNMTAYMDEDGNIPLDKGKSLINTLRAQQQSLEGKVDTQTLKAYGDAIKEVDSQLKAASPEYAEQMKALAADTQASTNLTDRFRSPQGAMNTLKRVQNGKDPFAADALGGYDKQFGTNFGDDLKDSFAKSDFEKPTTNGSRKAVTFGATGAAIGHSLAPGAGGYVGGALGAGVGALADVYGGAAVKAALDAGINLKALANTPYIKPIMDAATRGPKMLAVTHAALMNNSPAYKATQDQP